MLTLEMDSEDYLKQRIQELVDRLEVLSSGNVSSRDKISVMSDEVVDSNPYRYVNFFFLLLITS